LLKFFLKSLINMSEKLEFKYITLKELDNLSNIKNNLVDEIIFILNKYKNNYYYFEEYNLYNELLLKFKQFKALEEY